MKKLYKQIFLLLPPILLELYFYYIKASSFDYLFPIILLIFSIIGYYRGVLDNNLRAIGIVGGIVIAYLLAGFLYKNDVIAEYLPSMIQELDRPTVWFIFFVLIFIPINPILKFFFADKNFMKENRGNIIFSPYIVSVKILILMLIFFSVFSVIKPNDSFTIKTKNSSLIYKYLYKEDILKPFEALAFKRKRQIQAYGNAVGAMDKLPDTINQSLKFSDKKPIDISTEKGYKEYMKVQEERLSIIQKISKDLNIEEMMKKDSNKTASKYKW